jgi:hypothetical protein
MVKMKVLVKEIYPKILTYGCSAHCFCFLVKEISVTNIVSHLTEINKFFRNYQTPHAMLMNKGEKIPQLSNDTRWNSQMALVATFIHNHNYYIEVTKELLAKEGTIDKNLQSISKKVANFGIYKNAIDLEKQLKVVSTALDMVI